MISRYEITEQQLASELRTVVSRLIRKLRVKSESASLLSLTERSTLALLDQHKTLLPSEMAAMEKITTQSMSQIVNHLAELGYINRKTSGIDKRKCMISLSKKGYQVLLQVRSERDEWLTKALKETCSPKELRALERAIVPLTRLVDYE
ncbi:MAG: MarR family transcriptional regulator [Bacteroidetes bacterium]|nr:MarR family transcriptional regulator [Bacteroidota bacterium]MBS1935869.1 MarR family transcriptional regulator [Bacteroidota bacterium]